MSAQIELFAAEDGKVHVKITVGGVTRVGFEVHPDEAEGIGDAFREKAQVARRWIA